MADDTTSQDGTTSTTTAKRRPWQRGSTDSSAGSSAGPTTTTTSGSDSGSSGHGFDAAKLRLMLARLLWAICALFALILALAVLLIAVDANAKNDLVLWIIHRADNVDLGFFDLTNPIKDWDADKEAHEDVKTALFNYGIAAIVWLLIGKFLDKVVRA